MELEKALRERGNDNCELCGSSEQLEGFVVAPGSADVLEEIILTCKTCRDQLNGDADIDPNHWRCLNDSMWSDVSAVKVVVYRMLNNIKHEGWPMDLLDMMYLEEHELDWAKKESDDAAEDRIVHLDCNGVELKHGDSVVIIKDLNVKGTSLVAKRGTAVRNINLVHDNPDQIEGKVGGQKIVILTQYVKK